MSANLSDGITILIRPHLREITMSGGIWIIVVGLVAGIIARFLSPDPNTPTHRSL